jgi:hypothetical protein
VEICDLDLIPFGRQTVLQVLIGVFQKETDHVPAEILPEPLEYLAEVERIFLQPVPLGIVEKIPSTGV